MINAAAEFCWLSYTERHPSDYCSGKRWRPPERRRLTLRPPFWGQLFLSLSVRPIKYECNEHLFCVWIPLHSSLLYAVQRDGEVLLVAVASQRRPPVSRWQVGAGWVGGAKYFQNRRFLYDKSAAVNQFFDFSWDTWAPLRVATPRPPTPLDLPTIYWPRPRGGPRPCCRSSFGFRVNVYFQHTHRPEVYKVALTVFKYLIP